LFNFVVLCLKNQAFKSSSGARRIHSKATPFHFSAMDIKADLRPSPVPSFRQTLSNEIHTFFAGDKSYLYVIPHNMLTSL
jgi:hypothetical protein